MEPKLGSTLKGKPGIRVDKTGGSRLENIGQSFMVVNAVIWFVFLYIQ